MVSLIFISIPDILNMYYIVGIQVSLISLVYIISLVSLILTNFPYILNIYYILGIPDIHWYPFYP